MKDKIILGDGKYLLKKKYKGNRYTLKKGRFYEGDATKDSYGKIIGIMIFYKKTMFLISPEYFDLNKTKNIEYIAIYR